MNILEEDIQLFVNEFRFSDKLANAKFLITGGTGLIGSILVKSLKALNRDIHIMLPVRNIEKSRQIFGKDSPGITLLKTDLIEYLSTTKDKFDYIIHCASPTNGKYMVEHPIETFTLAIDTTRLILEYCKKYNVKSFVYISSLEYYGENYNDKSITEDNIGFINYSDPRSSYPLGKRAAEFLCKSYATQYGIPVKIARLTQTFGAGISTDDNRVFAQFAKSIINKRDIILHTQGASSKPYCYTIDCMTAILLILLEGQGGESYNVSNDETYISIKDMAFFLKEHFCQKINVIISESSDMGYAPETKLNLDSSKLRSLGWEPKYDLKEMYRRLIESMTQECNNK